MRSRSHFTATAMFFAVALLAMGLPQGAWADPIPPDDMFFAPSSLVEGVYPAQTISGDGEAVPFTMVWTEDDLLAYDPEISSATITSLEVLPILNPNPATTEGEYSAAALQAIDSSNYQQYYHFLPGWDVYDLNSHYSADLTDNVLTLSVVAPGPYTVRVEADVVVTATRRTEQRSYVYGQYVEDGLLLAGNDPWPTMVHRITALPEVKSGIEKGPGPLPSSDLYVVSQHADPDKYEEYSADNLTRGGENVARAGNPQDVIDAICAASAAAGGPISVTVIGHGNGPSGNGDPGFINIGTGCIGNYPGCMSPCDFGMALAGKVSSVTFGSCYTGSDGNFLQEVANKSGATCGGYTTTVTASKKVDVFGLFCLGGEFDLGWFGKKKKVKPADCNKNEVPDHFEIERGEVLDINANEIPDICEYIDVLEVSKSKD